MARRRPQGQGIGLFVCDWLARDLGGSIRHRSRTGGGTIFELALPPGRVAEKPFCHPIRVKALQGMTCSVALPGEEGRAAEWLLHRIGPRVRRTTGPLCRSDVPNDGVLLCASGSLPVDWVIQFEAEGRAPAAPEAPDLILCRRMPAARTEIMARRVHGPLLRSVLEPELLEFVLS
jgi:hypothetical protein